MSQDPENTSSSDEEAPDEQDFQVTRVLAAEEWKAIYERVAKRRDDLKLKRQSQQEKFISQKNDKAARAKKRKLEAEEEEDEEETTPGKLTDSPSTSALLLKNITVSKDDDDKEKQQQSARILPTPKKKVYKDLNIEVSTVDELKDSRAAKALVFRGLRMTKPRREGVLTNLAHKEKLKAGGKLCGHCNKSLYPEFQ